VLETFEEHGGATLADLPQLVATLAASLARVSSAPENAQPPLGLRQRIEARLRRG
jgi:hypothetical protein